ncbi:endoglucanase (plasmid) [Mycobacterium sp. JS623]|uniref:glycoside hydrolase family 5 protein n=1 Tax=Mycobacterium sp. JS623 TaxID=212767 RepID=UPI0002A54F7A|nr:glycoside hydrolase family 5 protein [Mycobacterium sp. JS623]AGB26659.1 endoglucanase [Mycobacterium sp. JS623]
MKPGLVLRACVGIVTAIATSMICAPASAGEGQGFHIVAGRLVESNGTPFVMRGTNHMFTWHPDQWATFADVKRLGANSLRVSLSGGRWTPNGVDDVRAVISECKRNRLICVLEDHDTSGYLTTQNEWSLDRAADYWISIKDALIGQENYVLINIGNEPYRTVDTAEWSSATQSAIHKLRDAGFRHTLIVDGPDAGEDRSFAMRDNAPGILNDDPDHNILFSVHMYGAFNNPAAVASYLDSFQTRGIPLLVGEFGDNSDDPNQDIKSDANSIMAEAVRRGIGYLGWCWSGNDPGGPAPHLDQAVDFDPNRLTPWGQRIFEGPDGIGATSIEATVYG